jgi:hypothetical protein
MEDVEKLRLTQPLSIITPIANTQAVSGYATAVPADKQTLFSLLDSLFIR